MREKIASISANLFRRCSFVSLGVLMLINGFMFQIKPSKASKARKANGAVMKAKPMARQAVISSIVFIVSVGGFFTC